MSFQAHEKLHIKKNVKRKLSQTESQILAAEWSEHCSYKSSKKHLRMLPTTGPNVIVEKGYDSGDVIVNCIGMIKPQVDKLGTVAAIKVNSLFPHYLSNVGEGLGAKVIHITTDCVWSGQDGNYTEDTPHDALDVYGKTKSLGEPENCTVIGNPAKILENKSD